MRFLLNKKEWIELNQSKYSIKRCLHEKHSYTSSLLDFRRLSKLRSDMKIKQAGATTLIQHKLTRGLRMQKR